MRVDDNREDHSLPLDGTGKTSGHFLRRSVVVSIAGFDPSSGAGVTADLKVFAALGLYGMACITALTVQSTQGVRAVDLVAAKTVAETLEMLADDVTLSGIKVGMLGTGEVAAAVADFLGANPHMPVVLDPVLRSSSGKDLIDASGLDLIRRRFLGRADWITPNLEELAILTGVAVLGREDIPAAAARLRRLGGEAGNTNLHVLVTGGHLAEPDDYFLDRGGEGKWIPGERVATHSTHGTGCALSSALLCGLVLGKDGYTAALEAKEFVAGALRAAYPVGRGRGPMNHFFFLENRKA